jgi:DNA repair exonuclease SbcCD ATPase subunit
MSDSPDTQPSPSTPVSGPASVPVQDGPIVALLSRFDDALTACSVQATDAQRASLHARIAEVVDELESRNVPIFSARSGPLRIHRVRLAGLLPFQQPLAEPYTFDFDRISGQVAAVVGRNGHGKSTLVESAVGAIFGRTLTRGPLDEIGIAQDIQWQVGTDIETATGQWHVERKRGGCAVYQPTDKPNVERQIARGHNAVMSWAKTNVPAPGVLMAGQFGVQRHRGHLLQLEPAPARDVVLSMLGLDVYQTISKAASERQRSVDADAAHHAGRLDEIQRAVNAIDQAESQFERLTSELGIARDALTLAEDALVVARESAPNPHDEAARKRRIVMLERDVQTARGQLVRVTNELAAVANAPPPPDMDVLQANVHGAQACVDAARIALREVEHRVVYSKDMRLASLRNALQEAALKAKQAPTISVRAIATDNDVASKAHADIARLDELRAQLDVAEHGVSLEQRALMDAQAVLQPVVDTALLEERAAQLRADIQQMDVELAELRFVPTVAFDDTHNLERVVREKQQHVSRIERDLAVAKSRMEHADVARKRLADQQAHAGKLTQARHEWYLIADLFGRNGVQGLAVDEIKPIVEEHANKLLRDCANGRWVVEVECKRNGDDEGRESFEVWAYDFQQDKRWKNARNLSPGESGIVGEAVAAAVSMYACAKAPHVQPTIVRDEVAIDVDRVDVQTWMRILRAEAAMLNASKVLVVSHDRNVINMCDTVLLVSNGTVKELDKEVRSG